MRPLSLWISKEGEIVSVWPCDSVGKTESHRTERSQASSASSCCELSVGSSNVIVDMV